MVPSGIVIGVGCLLGVQFHVEKFEVFTSYFHSGAIAFVSGENDGHIIGEGDGSKGLGVVTGADGVGVVGRVKLTEEGVKKKVPFQGC
jgi:hypothetical protein